jgi:tetratricopeptide (TPR) repeat protein
MRMIRLSAALLSAAAISAFSLAASADDMSNMSTSNPADMSMKMIPPGLPAMPAVYMGEADKPGAPMFKGLGDHRHPISTKNPQTQALFDQGVNLMFGFNHAEAIRSFREAARLDPDCAMCWWGVAFALGPNINLPMPDDAVAPAWEALKRAKALEAKASPEEHDWIEALATRYTSDAKADRKPLDEAFAQAMGKLWKTYPDDLDAGTFYAEAMMDTQPWDYWEADGVTPKGHALEIVSTLEGIIKRAPNHPGALHLYIHSVEATTTPERAEAAADALEPLMPEAGHVVHMPSHIYYRVGRYADAAHVNELAAKTDEDYIAQCKAQGYYPLGYYGHNIHFLWTSSEMEGRYQMAIDTSRRLMKATDAWNTGKQLPQAELFGFTPVVTLLRFGKWDALLAEPRPPSELKLDTAVSLYARGFAFANEHDLKSARRDRALLAEVAKQDLSHYDAFMVPAKSMVQLALVLLDGEIARTSGHLDEAIKQFRAASDQEYHLPYTEPPYWHQPVAHLLGAALLQAKRYSEAEAVYRKSLKSYRRDGWALSGLAEALQAQGKKAEAAQASADFASAWQMADVKIKGSRF